MARRRYGEVTSGSGKSHQGRRITMACFIYNWRFGAPDCQYPRAETPCHGRLILTSEVDAPETVLRCSNSKNVMLRQVLHACRDFQHMSIYFNIYIYISNSNHGFCSAVPELAKLNGCCDYSDYPKRQHLSALDPKRCKIESLNRKKNSKSSWSSWYQ